MVVALAAADGDAKPDGARGVDAVDDRLNPELLDVDAAFLVDERVAVEAGGDLLIARGMRQQVAGKLLDGEPVERHVLVQGIDHPVAIFPDRAWRIDVEAVRVGIAGDVQPDPPLHLAIMGRRQQSIDQRLIRRLRPGVPLFQEPIHFLNLRRQAGQVERQAADQRRASASGEGAMPRFSNSPRTNRSIGWRAQAAFFTLGSGGRRTG